MIVIDSDYKGQLRDEKKKVKNCAKKDEKIFATENQMVIKTMHMKKKKDRSRQ